MHGRKGAQSTSSGEAPARTVKDFIKYIGVTGDLEWPLKPALHQQRNPQYFSFRPTYQGAVQSLKEMGVGDDYDVLQIHITHKGFQYFTERHVLHDAGWGWYRFYEEIPSKHVYDDQGDLLYEITIAKPPSGPRHSAAKLELMDK